MAFHGLSGPVATRVWLREFGSALRVASVNPASSIAGRVIYYPSDYRAVVRTAHGRVLRISSVPLRASVGGRERPVSLRLEPVAGGFAPAAPATPLVIAQHLAGGVQIGSEGLRLVIEGVDVPAAAAVGGAKVFYSGVASDTDAAVVPTVSGVEVFALLRSRLSPEQLRYRISLPAGGELRSGQDGLQVWLSGRVIAHIPTPTALDAQGQPVPVGVQVAGDELILSVAHRSRDVAYPVQVDPAVVSDTPMPGWVFQQQGSGLFSGPAAVEIDGAAGTYAAATTTGENAWWEWSTANTGVDYALTNVQFSGLHAATPDGSATTVPGIVTACGPISPSGWGNATNSSFGWAMNDPLRIHLADGCSDTIMVYMQALSASPSGRSQFWVDAITLDATLAGPSRTETLGSSGPAEPLVPRCPAGKPVNCATGNQYEVQTDLRVPGRGVGLDLTRTYNSQAAATATSAGMFGYGWTSTFSDHLVIDPTAQTATVWQADGSSVPFNVNADGSISPAGPWIQAALSKNPDGTYLYTLPDRRALTFASGGRLVSEADRNANATSLAYDGQGRLATITAAAGRTLTLSYNADGTVSQATDPAGRKTFYGYAAGNLVAVTDVAGGQWQFGYDPSHQMTSMTDPNHGSTTTGYDTSNRVTSQVDALGRTRYWSYAAHETVITNPGGDITDERFNNAYEPVWITHAQGTSVQTVKKIGYDSNGLPVSVTDARGHTTTTGYDAAGNRTSQTDALARKTTWTYDAAHDVTSLTTPLGHTTAITYDAHGNPVQVSRSLDETGQTQTTSATYDATGQLTSTTDPLQRTTRYGYDAQGDQTSVTTPLGHKTTRTYDIDSRLLTATTANGNEPGATAADYTTTFTRDAFGRPTDVKDPLGHHATMVYDANGNLTDETDRDGRHTHTTYDAENQPVMVKRGDGSTQQTSYDANGQPVTQTDGNNHTTTYTRNALEQITAVRDPLGRTRAMTYDPVGNLLTLTDSSGRKTTNGYDQANELTSIHYSSGNPADVAISYDADGNRAQMTDQIGTSSYAYDSLDRLTSSTNGAGQTTSYAYDLASQPTQTTYPAGILPYATTPTPLSTGGTGVVTRTFDGDGNTKTISDWNANKTSYAYDAQGDIASVQRPDSSSATYTYDHNGLLAAIADASPNQFTFNATYTRTPEGLTAGANETQTTGGANTTYTYDLAGRLKTAGSTIQATYGYDTADNLTSLPATPGVVTPQVYDTANELTRQTDPTGTTTTSTFAYDPQGNRTSQASATGATQTYTYDQANELTAYTSAAQNTANTRTGTQTPTAQYRYDGDGLRTDRYTNSLHNAQAYDVSGPLPLLLADATTRYVYGPDGLPIEQITLSGTSPTGATRYYHHDQQGSTRALTDQTGHPTATYTYDAYGKPTNPAAATDNPFLYTGQYTDNESGLQYLRARYYDPTTGQLTSRDPLEAVTRQPYTYAADNPLNGSDPSGLFCVDPTGVTCGLQNTVINTVTKVVAVPVYGAYYVLYRTQSSIGDHLPGSVNSAITAVDNQLLTLDQTLDSVKRATGSQEPNNDENVNGGILPIHVSGLDKNPCDPLYTYLPGVHLNGDRDLYPKHAYPWSAGWGPIPLGP